MRKILISILGLAIIALGFYGMKKMSGKEKPAPEKEKKTVPAVFTQKVNNSVIPVYVTASGTLSARDRIELFSEVQGLFEYSDRVFKPGVVYKKGEILIRMDSDEHRANLRAQKSSLYNQVVALLPDLRFDYADAYLKWETYVNEFEMDKPLQEFPEHSSQQEKLFIASKNILTPWYTVKNLEERLSKYAIYAPYDGVLTQAQVTQGALIRQGQQLGEFINPRNYELEVSVNSTYADLLKVGSSVTLSNVEKTKTWNGKVIRLNSLVDPQSQTVQAYIRVNGNGLREGMYMEAELAAKQEDNAYEVSRKLIVENDKIYVVEGNVLKLVKIQPMHFTKSTAIIRGLTDGTEILEKTLPGAYDGMEVERFKG